MTVAFKIIVFEESYRGIDIERVSPKRRGLLIKKSLCFKILVRTDILI